jgi:hypothetical protein
MAIVPIVNDVSILDIREIINLKAAILGISYSSGTSYNIYGVDKNTGKIRLRLLNGDLVSYLVQIAVTGPVSRSTTVSISPNGTYDYSLSNLAAGAYTITVSIPADGRSDSTSISLGNGGVGGEEVSLGNNFDIQNISIAKDAPTPPTPATTSNYLRSGGINIVRPLPGTTSNADLSDWRGAQVFNITYQCRNSTKHPVYGTDKSTGFIRFQLAGIGFSSGSVSVQVGGSVIAKSVGTSTSFNFNNLSGGSRTCTIRDLTTGNTFSFIISLNKNGGKPASLTGVINGTDRITAFS